MGRVTGNAAARIVPDIGDDNRHVRLFGAHGDRPVEARLGVEHRHGRLPAKAVELAAEAFGKRVALWLVAVRHDDQARAHIRHVARHETVDD